MTDNNLKPYLMVKGTPHEFDRLQRAWTRTGLFKNRSQFVRAAINAYAGEKVFD